MGQRGRRRVEVGGREGGGSRREGGRKREVGGKRGMRSAKVIIIGVEK
jgi:hypothetical protein